MKKTQIKDAIRTIRKNFVSYLAVAIVTMIGCGVYFGAFFYADELSRVAGDYYRTCGFEDLDVNAPEGVNAEEIAKIASLDGILDAEGTFQIPDATGTLDGREAQITVVGLTDRIARAEVVEGEMPDAEGECALTADAMKELGASIGSTLHLSLPDSVDGLLKTEDVVVTAEILHPEDYRTGSVNYVFLPGDAFDQDFTSGYYTCVRIRADVPENGNILSPDYFAAIDPIKACLDDYLTEIAAEQEKERKEKAEELLSEKEEEANSQFRDAEAQIAEKEQELQEAETQIAEGETEIIKAEQQIADAEKYVNSRGANAMSMVPIMGRKVTGSRAEIEKNKALLEEKKAELAEAKAKAEDGRKQLEEAKAELAEKKADADREIEQAKEDIENMEAPVFIVLTRNEKEGYVALDQIVTILKRLASIFVIIFMGIGVIVVLSTITILIDNQKKLIGAMKAYGFRNREIIAKYAFFGVSAVIFGMLLSILLAYALQKIIGVALGGTFAVEPRKFSFEIPPYVLLLVIEFALAAVVAIVATYLNAVRSSAVDLMNGVTKERGFRRAVRKRKGNSLYSRLIFRNMRTDLARVICSVIIIAGSCLMIGVGFTLDFAFEHMTDKSVKEVTHYELEVTLPDGTDQEEIDALKNLLTEEGLTFAQMTLKQTRFIHDDKESYAYVITGENELFGDYLTLTDVIDGEILIPDEMEVYVPERLHETFGIDPGDTLSVYDQDMKLHTFTLNNIFRNYIGRNIYLSKDVFESVFGEGNPENRFLIRTGDRDKDGILAKIRETFPRADAERTDQLPALVAGFWSRMFHTLIFVMTGLSVIMSVFVLLNLVNIFVGRRKNELIIMGVNGFSYRQRIGYLLRETIATTLLGLILGTALGSIMTNYLVRVIEPTDSMFDRSIQPLAWLVASLLEGFFALLINFFAFRRVKQYQMTDLTR